MNTERVLEDYGSLAIPNQVPTRSARATNKAGNTGSGSTSFRVGVTFDSLYKLTKSYSKNAGVGQILYALLTVAQDAGAHGKIKVKNDLLIAYQAGVQLAQVTKVFTKEQADILTSLSKSL